MHENTTFPVRVSARCIDGTIYIVESASNSTASETADEKVKRLIVSNADISKQSKVS